LYVQLSRLRYQNNPPLITHAGSFALARRAIRLQILAITLRQTFTAWFR
jgi:hypothetical protein